MGRLVLTVMVACLLPGTSGASIIDDFEDGDLAEWQQGIGGDPLQAQVTAAAAHDGNYGLEAGTVRTGWLYRDDEQAHVSQGDIIMAWARLPNTSWNRSYLGFGATAAGCFSVVLSDNTNAFIIQLNEAYGYHNLASTPFTFISDYWYFVVVVWGVGGTITANLYDSDGTTVLATVSVNNNTYTEGGVAIRNFDSGLPGCWDTIMREPGCSPAESESWGGLKAMFRPPHGG